MTGPDRVERAVADIAEGRPVIVVDGEDREDEGDLVFAAEHATPELLAFMVRHTSGYVCAPLTGEDCDRLDLPPMYHTNQDRRGTAYRVTVDAREGVTTGVSAADRARTIRLLADPGSTAGDFTRPGHVVPLHAVEGGVLARPGHTEATVDLLRLAGLRPAGVLCELVSTRDPTGMARRDELDAFAAEHDLTLVTIGELVAYRRRRERRVGRVAEATLPTGVGTFRAVVYRSGDGTEHVALSYGDLGDGEDVLVRVHSECLTGDVLGSLRCDCGLQLRAAMTRVANEGRGVVLYLRGHEGRGIGLAAKLRAYDLQDRGWDTVDANLALGLPADARDYADGARILADLGVRTLRLLTDNPHKQTALAAHGLRITGRERLPVRPYPESLGYLRTKRDRLGHLLGDLTGSDLPVAAGADAPDAPSSVPPAPPARPAHRPKATGAHPVHPVGDGRDVTGEPRPDGARQADPPGCVPAAEEMT